MIHGGEAPGGGAVLCFLGRGGCGGGAGECQRCSPPSAPLRGHDLAWVCPARYLTSSLEFERSETIKSGTPGAEGGG